MLAIEIHSNVVGTGASMTIRNLLFDWIESLNRDVPHPRTLSGM